MKREQLDGTVQDEVLLTGSNPQDAQSNASMPMEGVMVYNGTTWDKLRSYFTNGDGNGVPSKGSLAVFSWPMLANGSTYDRQYNNTQGTLLASAARTGPTYSPTQTNYNAKGIALFLDVTAVGGTGGLMIKVRVIDPVTNKSVFLNIDPTTVTSIGTYIVIIYPGATGTTNTSAGVIQNYPSALPRLFQAGCYHVDATSYTYSLGYSLIL